MSFFGRLFGRGREAAPPPRDEPPYVLKPSTETARAVSDVGPDDGGRAHRHIFAHQILPSVVFEDPDLLMSLFADGGAARLRRLWERTGQQVQDKGMGRPAAGEGLDLGVVSLAGRRAALVTFPAPRQVPEAYFAAVLEGDADAGDDWRYLVLERTDDDDGPDPVLCEWLPGGAAASPSATAADVRGPEPHRHDRVARRRDCGGTRTPRCTRP